MPLSYQEKSLWLQLLALLVAFGLYFRWVSLSLLPTPAAADVMPHQIGLFVAAVVLMAIILVVGHIAAALFGDRESATDERDRAIEIRGTRLGAGVLAVSVFAALCVAAVTRGNVIMALVLLGGWVLATLASTATQIVLYRRGG